MTTHRWIAVAVACGLVVGSAFAQTGATPGEQNAAPPVVGAGEYMRVVDGDERLMLQIAARGFVPKEGTGPKVILVGAVHIGDKAYYHELQGFLDAQDLVLFEGVKPSLGVDAAHGDAAAKVKVTKSRQRFLAVLVSRYKAEHGACPESVEVVLGQARGTVARLGRAALVDAWGNAQQYRVIQDPAVRQGFDIVSLGEDGVAGGESAGADILFSEQKPLTKDELKASGEGIQAKLANALGLEFQLAAVDYNRAAWRNSDMTVDELQEKLEASGLSGGALFSLLDGSSLSSKLVSFILSFIEGNPALAMTCKVMLVETISHSDEMLAAQAGKGGKEMAKMAAFMRVLVVDRNEVVMKDLRAVIDEEPEVKTVALFFGAGHLPDMEKRLVEEFGYERSGEQWFTGMDLDLASVPGGVAQAKQMREMMKKTIEGQRK